MEKNNNLISVIVPVYNVYGYLDKCIQSIQRQSYPNIEIILVDDGSTDGSGVKCDEYAVKDSRIKVIHKTNGGLSDARNAGIEIAAGKWFSFIDSDDYISETCLEELLTAATDNECQVSVCNMVRVYEDGATEKFYSPVNNTVVLNEDERFSTLKQPSVCNKLFSSDLFQDVRFPVGKYYEDTFVYHILAHRAKRIALNGKDGYFYLSRRDSILGRPKYTDRYFDFVEAVYNRATYLIANKVDKYAEEACLSLYAAVATAEKNVKRNKYNKEKFDQMYEWYGIAYNYLMISSGVSIKQKIRLGMLKYFPVSHTMIY